MKKFIPSMLAGTVLVLAGCGLTTLHPIFKPEQLQMDNRLLGKWHGEDILYHFASAAHSSVEIPEKLKKYKTRFYLITTGKHQKLGFLIKIGSNYFLDVYPLDSEADKDVDIFYKMHKQRMHTVHRVDFLNATTLRIRNFEDSWLKDLIRKKQLRIEHSLVRDADSDGDDIVITASTADLQQFLLKYGDDPNAYDEDEKDIYTKK